MIRFALAHDVIALSKVAFCFPANTPQLVIAFIAKCLPWKISFCFTLPPIFHLE